MGPAHYKDLREAYSKRMEVHGLGIALFHPISAQDMRPPCCGYFDRNGDWNLICNLLPQNDPAYTPSYDRLGYEPLHYAPLRSSSVNIEWQPKTASGTQEHVMAASAETPDDQPAGAEGEVKYSSNSKFGAVLMTKKPITLTAYNNERLFKSWLEANRGILYDQHGTELKKYGMWLVTRTYTCSGCSINAWSDASKASIISTKAKAAMLGELGEDLKWNDRMSSRDWTHYNAATDEGLVVFMDGIDMSSWDWVLEGMRQKVPGRKERDRSQSRRRYSDMEPRRSSAGAVPSLAITSDAGADDAGLRRSRTRRASPPTAATVALRLSCTPDQQRIDTPMRPSPVSSQQRHSDQCDDSHAHSAAAKPAIDERILRDVGLRHSLSRSVSPMSMQLSSSPVPGRSPSLRRETRSISQEPAT